MFFRVVVNVYRRDHNSHSFVNSQRLFKSFFNFPMTALNFRGQGLRVQKKLYTG
jgi:hypothetical protein